MSNTIADDTSEYFSSDENISDENISDENRGNEINLIESDSKPVNMDFIKLKKQELKKFNVLFEKPDDHIQKYKKCMKCDQSFLYPHEYLNHCKNTYLLKLIKN